ncbi:MAG: 4-(cytidine 5'-diphospho)-2-C-methyl-D-erythritol kinase [Thermoleophilia bacterium]
MKRVVRAPAKVNLSLLVGPVAADGYHPLSTVFAPIEVFDELQFDLTVAPRGRASEPGGPGRRLEVVCPGIEPESNLVTRAVRAVETLTGWEVSGLVVVRKEIPVGAGLGGGSSDAAAALRVSADLVETAGGPRIEAAALAGAARSLGADVPFFLSPRPALAAGVGDLLEPLSLPVLQLVLLLPERPLSTAEVYRTFDSVSPEESPDDFGGRRRRNTAAWRELAGLWAGGELEPVRAARAVADLLQNDLERASLHLAPELERLKALLLEVGALGSLMSGSGPTIFGLYGTREGAEAAAAELARSGRRTVAAATSV